MASGAKQDQQENAVAADKACSASLVAWVVACLAVWVGHIGDLAEDSEDLEASMRAWVDACLACLCLSPSKREPYDSSAWGGAL